MNTETKARVTGGVLFLSHPNLPLGPTGVVANHGFVAYVCVWSDDAPVCIH